MNFAAETAAPQRSRSFEPPTRFRRSDAPIALPEVATYGTPDHRALTLRVGGGSHFEFRIPNFELAGLLPTAN